MLNNYFVLWMTGLSGAGKTTIAQKLNLILHSNNIRSYCLDGDILRNGLNKDLSFSANDRKENLRRAAEVAKILLDSDSLVIASFISPFETDRIMIKNIIGKDKYIEVYVECSIDTCIKRDPKGLYAKAIRGEIPNFTGISQEYEAPSMPNIVINTEQSSLDICVSLLEQKIKNILNS